MGKTFRKPQSEKKSIGAKSAKKELKNHYRDQEAHAQMQNMRYNKYAETN